MRTWFFTLSSDKILIKHDHRTEDDNSDEMNMYGAKSTNVRQANRQVFSADKETTLMLPLVDINVCWAGLKDEVLTYNLRRIGSERYFSMKFNLTKPVNSDWQPKGWK
ncbi:MAG: hypothetical protein U5M51_15850 [Emticicia sp.]|nr:hypothetical protein [Emticicia sp.]